MARPIFNTFALDAFCHGGAMKKVHIGLAMGKAS